MSVALQLSTMYGYKPKSLDDRVIQVADESSALAASLLLPGATIINVLPILRHVPAWFPFAESQKRARRCKEITEEVKAIPLNYVKQAFVSRPTPNLHHEAQADERFCIRKKAEQRRLSSQNIWNRKIRRKIEQ